jgi:nucleoside-diphosphate-sugar epimerase
MARELLAAHQAGRVEVATGRASDYFGPRGGAQSNLGDRVLPAALRGATATVLGDPDQPHTYTYVPDIGEGLAVLGEHPDAAGQVWHLPNDPSTRTTRELVSTVYALAGFPARLRRVPPWLLRLAALRDRDIRAVLEMGYLFEEPFIVDSSKITNKLGVSATPLPQALDETPCHLPRPRALALQSPRLDVGLHQQRAATFDLPSARAAGSASRRIE